MLNFASESTFHGVNFIFGENRTKCVRYFWFFVSALSFCGFSFYFYNSYFKYQYEPDIAMRRKEKFGINFPSAAMTICPKIITKENIMNDQVSFEGLLNISS